MCPLQRVERRWCVDTVLWARIALVPSVVLVLVCSLPDVGIRIRLMGKVSLVSPWSWCSCVVLSYGGESFSPDDASDSALDSVMPMKGKHTIIFLQYQGVWCVAMLCGGENFPFDGAYDFAWVSVKPMKGKYTIKYIQYQVVVECGCMLKDWISSCCVFAPTTTTTSSPFVGHGSQCSLCSYTGVGLWGDS